MIKQEAIQLAPRMMKKVLRRGPSQQKDEKGLTPSKDKMRVRWILTPWKFKERTKDATTSPHRIAAIMAKISETTLGLKRKIQLRT